METNLKKLGKLGDYTLDRRKAAGGEMTVANYVEAGEILQDIASNYAQHPGSHQEQRVYNSDVSLLHLNH